MAVTFRSVGVSPGADSTTCVVVKPVGLAVDDLMIAQITVWVPTSIAHPAGWTRLIATEGGAVIKTEIFWKIAVQADVDATDFTFTLGLAKFNHGAISVWYGHDPSTPINASSGQYNASSATATAPTITPSVANCMLLLVCSAIQSTTYSGYAIATDNPPSWTERYDLYAGFSAISTGSAIRPETTATGNGTATLSTARDNIGQLVAIAPEPIVVPTVTTQAATDILPTTATGNGNITDNGGENCDIRGIVWDLASQGAPGNVAPGASGYANDEAEGGSFGTGAFTRSLTGLPSGTTIYARAYAHNSAGYAYGGEVNFTTLSLLGSKSANMAAKMMARGLI